MSDCWCRLQNCFLECALHATSCKMNLGLGNCTYPRGKRRGKERGRELRTESQESFINLQVKFEIVVRKVEYIRLFSTFKEEERQYLHSKDKGFSSMDSH